MQWRVRHMAEIKSETYDLDKACQQTDGSSPTLLKAHLPRQDAWQQGFSIMIDA